MRVYVRNKFVSVGGSSEVVDDNKQPVFRVKGKWFSITKKKKIYDTNKNFLYMVRNAIFKFHPSAYIYNSENQKIARVKKKIWTMRSTYFVEGFEDEIKIDGNFIGWDFNVLRNDTVIGHIKREFNVFNDSFCVDGEDADIPFLVALVIAIDNITDRQRDS